MRTSLSLVVFMAGLVCAAGYAFADGSCTDGDVQYLNGSRACLSGTPHECQDGEWKALRGRCALQPITSQRQCPYEGQYYASGIIGCQSGTQQRCEDGEWVDLRLPCVAPNGAVEAPLVARNCRYSGADFQPQAMMCKGGKTFVCQRGQWTDLMAPCPD
jgi:hypothetical protein